MFGNGVSIGMLRTIIQNPRRMIRPDRLTALSEWHAAGHGKTLGGGLDRVAAIPLHRKPDMTTWASELHWLRRRQIDFGNYFCPDKKNNAMNVALNAACKSSDGAMRCVRW